MRNRRALLALLLGLVALLVGVALCMRPAPPPPSVPVVAPAVPDAGPAPVAAAVPQQVEIKAAKGKIEVRRGGEKDFRRLLPTDALLPTDTIRTGAGSEVELVAGDHVVRLIAGTQITVGELTADLTTFLLSHGLVGAEARGAGGRALEVRAEGFDAAARTSAGRFRMTHNGAGTVAVGAEEGEVSVRGAGQSVVLKKGERTVVLPGKAPEPPKPMATSLLMKVAWPQKRETNQRVITVTGRTEAGALVFALGERVAVGEDGSFEAKLRLREGNNRIQLEAIDVGSNTVVDDQRVTVNTQGAASKFNTDDLWRQ